MNQPTEEPQPVYHLFLDPDEVPMAAGALRLLISDEAHEAHIRTLAREVIEGLHGSPDEHGVLTVALSEQQMKIAHTAMKLLLDDTQREQSNEREVLRHILDKLPDEHTMRAIRVK